MLILALLLFATIAYFAFGVERTCETRPTATYMRERFFSSPLSHWRGCYLSLSRRDRQLLKQSLLVLNAAVRRWAANVRLWRSSASDEADVLGPVPLHALAPAPSV
jgi:hypothetical protein